MSTTKAELIEQITIDAGITKTQAAVALNSFETTMMRSVKKHGRFSLPGIGTFTKKRRKASSGVIPGSATGERWKKGAHNTVSFKAAPAFKDFV